MNRTAETTSKDATQRVRVDNTGMPHPVPAQSRQNVPAGAAASQRRRADAERAKKKRKDQTTLIILCAVVLVLLIAIIIAIAFLVGGNKDNGLILNNVYAAGVNLGNMTPEQAKDRLNSIADEYSELKLTVQVVDTTIELDPAQTGAKLDVNAVVDAAYDYGRTGSRSEQKKAQNQAASTSHTISIIPYLNLDLEYISQKVSELGDRYSSLRTDPKVTIVGDPAPPEQEVYDLNAVYQTMTVILGTAQYGLSTSDLYDQILDAYDSRIFQVVGECSVDPPESPEALIQSIYNQYCRAPKDAEIDSNYTVTTEVYGYGFTMEDVMAKVAEAAYGSTITVPMGYIEPDITAEKLAGDLFQSILGSCSLDLGTPSDAFKTNINMVIKLLNNKVLKAGESFSFNDLVGETTVQRGYKKAFDFNGTKWEEKAGGGITRIASALYYCALQGDLEITERHSHAYAPSYIPLGMDADIVYGTKDLRFRNNTPDPIRITAEYSDGRLKISMLGSDVKTYSVSVDYVIESSSEGKTLFQTMSYDNPGGYIDGQVLQEAITGYVVKVYQRCTFADSSTSEVLVGTSHYAKRNALVVKIYTPTNPDPGPLVPPVSSDSSLT